MAEQGLEADVERVCAELEGDTLQLNHVGIGEVLQSRILEPYQGSGGRLYDHVSELYEGLGPDDNTSGVALRLRRILDA